MIHWIIYHTLIYSLTSCRPVVRALVYQPRGLGLIPGMSCSESAIWENPNDTAATKFRAYDLFLPMAFIVSVLKRLKIKDCLQGMNRTFNICHVVINFIFKSSLATDPYHQLVF
jgi:hypothetical protein